MQAAKRGMNKENEKMRRLVDVYIKSTDLNDPVWDLLFDEDSVEKNNKKVLTDENDVEYNKLNAEKTLLGFKRRDAVDAGKLQLKNMNRLDIEMNEILTNVLKEENRQRLLITDVIKLIEKNSELFQTEDGDNDVDISFTELNTRKASNKDLTSKKLGDNHIQRKKKVGFADPPETVETGVQVDSRDDFGFIVDNDFEATEIAPHQQSIVEAFGMAPLAPMNLKTHGLNYPIELRKYMKSFPSVLRIPPTAWICQMIMSIYLTKMQSDALQTRKRFLKFSLPAFVYQYFKETVGIDSSVDVQIAVLITACGHHMKNHPRVSIFANQLGLTDTENLPPLDVRDTDFVLHIIQSLIDQGELLPANQSSKKIRISKPLVNIKHEISRTSAINIAKQVFEKWLPDHGDDMVIPKVNALPATDKAAKNIDVDHYINALIEPWRSVRLNWEEHARYLFHQHCCVYRVLQEVEFANDEGKYDASDALLVEIQKSTATNDCTRRAVRTFQQNFDDNNNNSNSNNANDKKNENKKADGSDEKNKKIKDDKQKQNEQKRKNEINKSNINNNGNNNNNNNTAAQSLIDTNNNNNENNNTNLQQQNKEPICELMNKRVFSLTLTLINPLLNQHEVLIIFFVALFYSLTI
jgi:hypothetical protein